MFSAVIIEDNKATAEMIHRVIDWKSINFYVDAVLYDGVRGNAAIMRYKPDLIIADINMPGMDGLTMLETCRTALPYTVIIFITAYDDFQYAYRAIKLRAFDYLLKPFSQTELKELINRAAQEVQKNAYLQAKRVLAEYLDEAEQTELPLIVKEIRKYIVENISQKLSLETLAEEFNVSTSHMGKLIKQHTKKNYSDYLTEIRVAYAKALLMNPRHRVNEISAMVGYRNYVTFYKVFKRYERVSPTTFRNEASKGNSQP